MNALGILNRSKTPGIIHELHKQANLLAEV